MIMGLYRRHTRSRLADSRRKARLFCQQILENMDREQQLTEHYLARTIPEDEEEATLH